MEEKEISSGSGMLHCILNEIHNGMTFEPSETAKTEVSYKNIDIQSSEVREESVMSHLDHALS